jgi:uncharacterized delta-60 repeat protein
MTWVCRPTAGSSASVQARSGSWAAGSLDPSFAANGYAQLAGGRSVAVYPDGRFVAASDASGPAGPSFSAQRFLANGAPDPSWNGGNAVVFQIASGSQFLNVVRMQPDGKILLGGYVWVAGSPSSQTRVGLARLNVDGTFDPSFNGTGKLLLDRGVEELPYAFAFQPDGKILVGTNTAGR